MVSKQALEVAMCSASYFETEMNGGCARVIQVEWLLLLSDDIEWLGAGSKPNATVCSISVEKDNMKPRYIIYTMTEQNRTYLQKKPKRTE